MLTILETNGDETSPQLGSNPVNDRSDKCNGYEELARWQAAHFAES